MAPPVRKCTHGHGDDDTKTRQPPCQPRKHNKAAHPEGSSSKDSPAGEPLERAVWRQILPRMPPVQEMTPPVHWPSCGDAAAAHAAKADHIGLNVTTAQLAHHDGDPVLTTEGHHRDVPLVGRTTPDGQGVPTAPEQTEAPSRYKPAG